MTLSALVLLAALSACARRSAGVPVWSEGLAWHGDDLRVYFSPQDPSSGPCVGAQVRLDWHAPPRSSELFVTFFADPVPPGTRLDVPVTSTSELGFAYVEVAVDPEIFEAEGSLLVHVPNRPAELATPSGDIEFDVLEVTLRRDPAVKRSDVLQPLPSIPFPPPR